MYMYTCIYESNEKKQLFYCRIEHCFILLIEWFTDWVIEIAQEDVLGMR